MSLKLTVEGTTAEELLSNLIAAANAMSAGAGLALSANYGVKVVKGENSESYVAGVAKEDAAAKEEPAADTPAPTGRRGGRKAAEKAPEPEAEAELGAELEAEEPKEEPKGRRSRGAAKKDELVNDNEEQAALRAQLIVDLQDLADVEEAHGQVQEALQRTGAKSVKEVASASLGDFNEAIQVLIGKYFE